jgi:hypothetical protein
MGFGREKHDPTRSIQSQKSKHDPNRSISSQKSMITKSSHDPNRSISSNSVLLHPVSETHGKKKQVRKIPSGFGRNMVSDGLFLISVDLITVTIQRLTYTLHSQFLYKPIFPSPYALSAFNVVVRRFRFCLVFSGRSVFP